MSVGLKCLRHTCTAWCPSSLALNSWLYRRRNKISLNCRLRLGSKGTVCSGNSGYRSPETHPGMQQTGMLAHSWIYRGPGAKTRQLRFGLERKHVNYVFAKYCSDWSKNHTEDRFWRSFFKNGKISHFEKKPFKVFF